MFGGLDPKKMKAVMKQMGIGQQEIPASRVIIEKEDGKIIIENPVVVKIKMQGQESFQISGDINEESVEGKAESKSNDTKLEADIEAIVEQTGVSKDVAAIELEKNNGDIAETIISLSEKKKKIENREKKR